MSVSVASSSITAPRPMRSSMWTGMLLRPSTTVRSTAISSRAATPPPSSSEIREGHWSKTG